MKPSRLTPMKTANWMAMAPPGLGDNERNAPFRIGQTADSVGRPWRAYLSAQRLARSAVEACGHAIAWSGAVEDFGDPGCAASPRSGFGSAHDGEVYDICVPGGPEMSDSSS